MIKALVAITMRQSSSSSSMKRNEDETRIMRPLAMSTSSTISSFDKNREHSDEAGVRSVKKSISAFVIGGKKLMLSQKFVYIDIKIILSMRKLDALKQLEGNNFFCGNAYWKFLDSRLFLFILKNI